MAKSSKTTKESIKVNFGTKKKGLAKRKFGPKEQKPKNYKGQGR